MSTSRPDPAVREETPRILVTGPDTYSCGTTYAVTNGIVNGLGIALRIVRGES